jgi:hypothetical protein
MFQIVEADNKIIWHAAPYSKHTTRLEFITIHLECCKVMYNLYCELGHLFLITDFSVHTKKTK